MDAAVVVALGSNLAGDHGSCEALLESALARMTGLDFAVVARSSWWRSAAWPSGADPEYLNGVVLIGTEVEPREVLARLETIEREFGRTRGEVNAPRTLDLDLVAHGRAIIDDARLTLPHPRAHERRFVMGPLAEIAPEWRHPVSGETAAALALSASVGADARPVGAACAALHKRPRNAI